MKNTAPAPFVPLSSTGIPFERVGIDLVGPFPKSAQDHKYILVIVDYTTGYPETVPLWKATSKYIAAELVLLFSCVGLPKDILIDQDMHFVSSLMTDVCWLLQVKQVCTSVYHPQTLWKGSTRP